MMPGDDKEWTVARRRKAVERSPEELVVELHPYNEWTAGHTRAAAGEIAELLRYLNHATQHPEALPDPLAVADLLHLLGQSVRRLPQALQQAARRADALGAGEIGRELFDPEGEAGSRLGERLDAIGLEIERIGGQARRLHNGGEPVRNPSDW